MPHKDPEARRRYQQSYGQARKPQHNAINQAWRARNKDRLNAQRRAKYANNPTPELLKCAEYREEHSKERCVLSLAYAKRNPEKVNARNRRYQLRKRGAPISDFTLAQWHDAKVFFQSCCVYCERTMQRLTQDHFVPLSKDGSHTISNVVPACKTCNGSKHNKDAKPWLEKRVGLVKATRILHAIATYFAEVQRCFPSPSATAAD